MRLLLSSGFQTGITESFHLINTVRTSTSILTAEVRKVVRAEATDRVLEALYPLPPGASGQNLRAFSNQTSTHHDHSLAALWLFTVIGLYEVWAAELPIAGSEANCQFPSRGYNAISTKAGVGAVLSALQPSPSFTTVYGATVATDSRMIDHARLDDALAVYRLFKECRNSLAHAGGVASDRLEQWSIDVRARGADLLVDAQGARVQAPQFAKGDVASIGFDQMRAFVFLLLRVAFTIDAAVLISTIGETEFLLRWTDKYGKDAIRVSRKKLNRGSWVNARLADIAVPTPPIQTDITAYLISNNMVRDIP
jgi:hypothetical protein